MIFGLLVHKNLFEMDLESWESHGGSKKNEAFNSWSSYIIMGSIIYTIISRIPITHSQLELPRMGKNNNLA